MKPADTDWRPVADRLDADFRYYKGLYLLVVNDGADWWTWSVSRSPDAAPIFTDRSRSSVFARRYCEEFADDVADIESTTFAPSGDQLVEIASDNPYLDNEGA